MPTINPDPSLARFRRAVRAAICLRVAEARRLAPSGLNRWEMGCQIMAAVSQLFEQIWNQFAPAQREVIDQERDRLARRMTQPAATQLREAQRKPPRSR